MVREPHGRHRAELADQEQGQVHTELVCIQKVRENDVDDDDDDDLRLQGY